MLQLDVSKFVTDLVHHLAGKNNIPWAPTLIYQPLLRICTPENETLLGSIDIVGTAIETISAIETPHHAEEYYNLLPNLGPSPLDFKSFFASSVAGCFFNNYSPFSFLRYLSYVTSFSFFCYFRGYVLAPDFAILSVLDVVRKRKRIFTRLWTWMELVNEAGRVNSPDFVHPIFVDNITRQ